MVSTPPISVGIIGAGAIAATMHLPVLLAMPVCRIAWILDVAKGRARTLADNHGLSVPTPQGIADAPPCDVALMALPTPPRGPYFEAFLPTMTAIFTEKPLASDAAQHARLAEAFEPWRLSVGYQRRKFASYRLVRQIIETGALGRLVSVRIGEGGRIARTGGGGVYMDLPIDQGGGIVLNLGCHSLDAALWIVGAHEFELIDRSVEWDGRTDRKATARIGLKRAADAASAVELDWTVSWLDPQTNTMEFRFADAALTCPITPSATITLSDRTGQKIADLCTADAGGAQTVGQSVYLEWRDVFDAACHKREASASGRGTLLTARLMDALIR